MNACSVKPRKSLCNGCDSGIARGVSIEGTP
jgi:hypothetical protein